MSEVEKAQDKLAEIQEKLDTWEQRKKVLESKVEEGQANLGEAVATKGEEATAALADLRGQLEAATAAAQHLSDEAEAA